LRTYRAGLVADPVASREFARIERAANAADPFAELQILHGEPDRLREGMVVYADGTNWDPGSGEGMYRRNVANNAWVFLG
jgi:hypothetical protein